LRVAVLDDYQRVAMKLAEWSSLPQGTQVDAFSDHIYDEDPLVERLKDYDVVIGMRERTPMRRSLLERLPKLKLLITTGMGNASFDFPAATELGIVCCGTGGLGGPSTAELAWGLILSLAKHIQQEDAGVRQGKWQLSLTEQVTGKTLGIVGLGRLGTLTAKVGLAFSMRVLAWSQNLTPEKAQAAGVEYATKDDLFSQSDYVSIHYQLSDRSRGMIGARELGLMKPTAYLINTSRGPIVDEQALVKALETRAIAGAGLDVFDIEPLPLDHPLRRMENTVITPHLGYVTQEGYPTMFANVIENIHTFLVGDPVRVINPDVLERPNLRHKTDGK
jgi:phosphoglycerate dehydrogenase-like enzyme